MLPRCNQVMTTTDPSLAASALVASASSTVRAQFLRDCQSFGARMQEASGGADALAMLEKGACQVLFLDQHLPDLDAAELRQIIHMRFPGTEVVMLDSVSQTDQVCSANPAWGRWLGKSVLGSGSAPALPAPSEQRLTDEAAPNSRADDVSVRETLPSNPQASNWRITPLPEMIGDSVAMQRVYRLTRLVARHSVSVLIVGETGTGKELVARAIHQLSRRAGGPFVALNCAAIPEALLEAELFGYVRGAFTGAQQTYAGRIQAAQGGTLFLDEVGEMPVSVQAKLLRFLDRREIQRLGSADAVRVDARVVAATNRNLEAMAASGDFRADLYYRLAAFPLELPPLAERREDVLPLARFFLSMMACSCTGVPRTISPDAEHSLLTHAWGGNVRELQQVLERAAILAEDESQIGIEHVYFGPHAGRKTAQFQTPAPQRAI